MAHILVVDDEKLMRENIRDMLEMEGYEATTASGFKGAIASIREYHFELAIVDLVIPGKDGFEIIKELRDKVPDIKILAISGGDAANTKESYLYVAEEIGIDGVLSKPFDKSQLISAIDGILGLGTAL